METKWGCGGVYILHYPSGQILEPRGGIPGPVGLVCMEGEKIQRAFRWSGLEAGSVPDPGRGELAGGVFGLPGPGPPGLLKIRRCPFPGVLEA